MFATDSAPADAVELVDLAAIRGLLSHVRPATETAVLRDQIRALRELSSVLAATEASVAATFVAARRAEQVDGGMPARRVGQGIGQELGLARRESPNRAGRYAGFASVLVRELPATYAALRAGETTEWRAILVARETGWLSLEHRLAVDADLGPRLQGLADRQVHAEAARLAYRWDPQGKIEQLRRAAGGRRVTLVPADDGMTKLVATLPLTQGVAVLAALTRAADQARAAGDPRSRGQVMADTLVELVTGQRTAEGVPLRVDLIITDQALFNTSPRADEPATVSGFGPIPAPAARDLITRTADSETADSETADSAAADEVEAVGEQPDTAAVTPETPTVVAETPAATPAAAGSAPAVPDTAPAAVDREPATAAAAKVAQEQAMVRIRRLFTDPAGRLVAMETNSREFTPAMAELIRLRDQWCTTPYCGAPIRHIDHQLPWAQGGPTSLANAQGLCEACNYAKQAPGWTTTPLPDGTVRTTTPTGHDTTTFTRPRAPAPDRERPSSLERAHRQLLAQHRRRQRHARHRAPARTASAASPPTTCFDVVEGPHRVRCEFS